MKCEVTSNTTHGVLISKDISFKSYKEICSGEKKKVNLGFNNDHLMLKVENNTLMPYPPIGTYLYGENSALSYSWEVLLKFLSIHSIEPNWLNCDFTWGWFEEELGHYFSYPLLVLHLYFFSFVQTRKAFWNSDFLRGNYFLSLQANVGPSS